jgi:hypothetical protein
VGARLRFSHDGGRAGIACGVGDLSGPSRTAGQLESCEKGSQGTASETAGRRKAKLQQERNTTYLRGTPGQDKALSPSIGLWLCG